MERCVSLIFIQKLCFHKPLCTSLATECRTFLLYYLPLLAGILPDMYLAHALLLSKAIRLLLGDRLSQADIDIAENMLQLFWRLTEQFYH